MNKHYLVSIIECAEEEENNFFTDFRLFANKERAEEYYANNLNNFLSEKEATNGMMKMRKEPLHITVTHIHGSLEQTTGKFS